ncbi:SsgA family sporulation/cell division regulator [Streptomyces sp. NPDC018019]|uniref:SsgA family sporulation/cell division regulator n=1 Tax=Streptomyces sp. NPDC018019 TaxID=3365030 RepID=UPI003796C07E
MDTHRICAPLDLELIESDRSLTPLDAVLIYDSSDPFVIRLDIDQGECPATVWALGRDLLADGIGSARTAGSGDVKIRRCDSHQIHIRLTASRGEARLIASWDQAYRFVRQTYGLVPRGCEADHVDIDAELRLLLGEAA